MDKQSAEAVADLVKQQARAPAVPPADVAAKNSPASRVEPSAAEDAPALPPLEEWRPEHIEQWRLSLPEDDRINFKEFFDNLPRGVKGSTLASLDIDALLRHFPKLGLFAHELYARLQKLKGQATPSPDTNSGREWHKEYVNNVQHITSVPTFQANELRGILQQTFPGELGDLYSCCAELLSGNADLASTTNLRPKLDNASKLFGTYANANFPSWPQSLTDQNAIDWSAYTDNPMLDGLSDLHTIVENLREVAQKPFRPQEPIYVLVGPSGVGKTTLLRAIGEGCWSFFLEMPGEDGRTKLGCISCRDLFVRETIQLEKAIYRCSCYLLAKHALLLYLFAKRIVKSPIDWLHAQLNGYDQVVKATFARILAWKLTPESLRVLCSSAQHAVEKFISRGVPLLCLIDEAQQCFAARNITVIRAHNGKTSANWLAPLLQAADKVQLRVHLAGTRFDFSYLPRVASAIQLSSAIVPLHIWRTFKFYSEEDVFQRLRPLLSMSDDDLHKVSNLVQGRSRLWVSVLSKIVENPKCTVAQLYSSLLTASVILLGKELALLCETDTSFPTSLASYYVQLLFNRMKNNELCIPLLQQHGGVFFMPYKDKNNYVPLSLQQVIAREYLPGREMGGWPVTAPVEPLHFLAIQETALEYPGQVLWAVATALTTGETPPSRASNLDGVLALLLVFLSAEKLSVAALLSRIDPDVQSGKVVPPLWTQTCFLPELQSIAYGAVLLDYFIELQEAVIALPETAAGCDVVCFLVDAHQQPCGVLSVSCCRYQGRVTRDKDKDQEIKVHLGNQYMENGKHTERSKKVTQFLQHSKLKHFVELLVTLPGISTGRETLSYSPERMVCRTGIDCKNFPTLFTTALRKEPAANAILMWAEGDDPGSPSKSNSPRVDRSHLKRGVHTKLTPRVLKFTEP